jgi:hypothetical protein
MLSTCEVQGASCFQRKPGTQLCRLQKYGLGHDQRDENLEQFGIGALQYGIATSDRLD